MTKGREIDKPAANSYDRCPKCRYDIRGITAELCPECGGSIDPTYIRRVSVETERRRRTRWALVCFLLSPIAGAALARIADSFKMPHDLSFGMTILAAAAWYLWAYQEAEGGPWRRAAAVIAFAPFLTVAYAVFATLLLLGMSLVLK